MAAAPALFVAFLTADRRLFKRFSRPISARQNRSDKYFQKSTPSNQSLTALPENLCHRPCSIRTRKKEIAKMFGRNSSQAQTDVNRRLNAEKSTCPITRAVRDPTVPELPAETDDEDVAGPSNSGGVQFSTRLPDFGGGV
jgi:hypothetical protein